MNSKLERFRDLVKDIEVAMMTTSREDGLLVSRPMATQVFAGGADLWFVTTKGSPKLAEIELNASVNLSYYKDRTREWISVAGHARIVEDRSKIHELYRPDWRAWFEDLGGEENGGPDDPRMVLIAVDIRLAHYMEVNKPQAIVLFELVKGMVTGKSPEFAEVETLSEKDAQQNQ
jgi:general stress protein 26